MRAKRCLDLLVTIPLLLSLLPLLLLLAILIRFQMGSPVIFRQARGGLRNGIFYFYKFRTMTDERDGNGNLLPDADRLTPLGAWLRTTSLDELPQLWNVLRGDMSLVGPRPLMATYLPRYDVNQRRRHDVLPGVTGWAQINGRNSLSWAEKFALDLWYVEHRTFALDLKILWRTCSVLLRREGVSHASSATMPEFLG